MIYRGAATHRDCHLLAPVRYFVPAKSVSTISNCQNQYLLYLHASNKWAQNTITMQLLIAILN